MTSRLRTDSRRTASLGMALLAVAAAGLMTPSAASAQGLGLEVDGGYRALQGEELEGLEDGYAAHALLSYGWPSGWEMGAGVGISFHDPEATGRDGDITEAVGLLRYRFNVPAGPVQHVHPFLEGRGGLARFHTSSGGADDISQPGVLVGGQGGVEFWLTDAVGLVGAVGLEYLSFSAEDGLPERSGWSVRPHAGLKIRY